jgi:hypothetical protein
MLLGNFGKKTIDALSFTSEIRELCEILNRKLDQSDEGRSKSIVSHPGGFSKELSRRRLSIAESCIRVIHELGSDHYEERLSALRNNCAEKSKVSLHRGSDYAKKMKELFLADGALLYLTDFSICEFEGKNAFALNAMVATHYPRFCGWIRDFKD